MTTCFLRRFALVLLVILPFSALHYSTAAQIYDPHTLLRQALQVALTIEKQSDQAYAITKIASLQARAGDIADAIATTEKVKYEPDRDEALITIATAYAESGDIGNAMQMSQRIVVPSVKNATTANIAKIQASKGDWQGAWIAAVRLPDDNVRASTLLGLAERQGETTTVSFDGLTWSQAELVEDYSKYGRLVALAKKRKFQQCEEILATLRVNQVKRHAFRTIALSQVESGSIPLAIQTVSNIEDWQWRGSVLIHIARVQAESGDVLGARETVKIFENDIGKGFALHSVASGQIMAGDTSGALATALEIRFRPERYYALLEVAKAFALNGDAAKAQEIATMTDDNESRELVLRSIASVRAQAGDVVTARRIANSLEQNRLSTLSEIAQEQAKSGDIEGAFGTVRAIRNQISAEGSLLPLLTTQQGEIRYEIVAVMYHLMMALSQIAFAQAKAGDIASAERTFSSIEFEYTGYRKEMLRDMAKVLNSSVGSEKTFAWATSIASPTEKTYALLGMVEALIAARHEKMVKVKPGWIDFVNTPPMSA